MIRLAIHLAIGLAALGLLILAVWLGSAWLELAAAFFLGWFGGKAHGCCTICHSHTHRPASNTEGQPIDH